MEKMEGDEVSFRSRLISERRFHSGYRSLTYQDDGGPVRYPRMGSVTLEAIARDRGLPVDHRVDSAEQIADVFLAQASLGNTGGILVANPMAGGCARRCGNRRTDCRSGGDGRGLKGPHALPRAAPVRVDGWAQPGGQYRAHQEQYRSRRGNCAPLGRKAGPRLRPSSLRSLPRSNDKARPMQRLAAGFGA